MNALLNSLSSELNSRINETQGTFGGVEMGYEEMYQSFYSIGEPCLFPQMVVESCGYSSAKECPQEEYWDMANELALEFGVCPENVHPDDFEPDSYLMSADRETLYIYLVNYKGEGEGYFKHSEVKSKIKGKYIGKYNYA